jgi:hypothetical protein
MTGVTHSHIHKNPKHEKDIQVLMTSHKKFRIHETVPGRQALFGKPVKDCRLAGILAVRDKQKLDEYHQKREVYFKAASSEQYFPGPDTPPPSPDTQAALLIDPTEEPMDVDNPPKQHPPAIIISSPSSDPGME